MRQPEPTPEAPGEPPRDDDVPRERLELLMFVRVVLVTIFLGSAIAIDVTALSSLSDPGNLTILLLIVGTYLLTIVYAVLVRRLHTLYPLAVGQILLDVVSTAILAGVTGKLDSPLLFLFYLSIISAAVVIGRRAAFMAAAATTAAFCLLAASRLGIIDVLPEGDIIRVMTAKVVLYRLVINSIAAFIVAYLAGYLSERLGEATAELEQRHADIRQLQILNENILASLNSGLLTVDLAGEVIFFNHAAEEITGIDRDDVLERNIRDVLPTIADLLEENGEDENPTQPRRESLFRRPDGKELYLGFSVTDLKNASDETTGRIVIFQDLSEIKRLEQQMRRSERLAAVGELAAAIAHEIRNPLASISGSVEMLDARADADDHEHALMRIVIREVDRLDSLIGEFLNYSRPREFSIEPGSLGDVIADVLGLFENRSGSHVSVERDLPDGEVRVRLDPEAMNQVLWNLLNNAADAVSDLENPRIFISLTRQDDEWQLAIEDNGPGVDEELRDRIFEPFFTTKAGGTGLGLATIHRIVEDHGGRISLEEPQRLTGARFEITLEAYDSPRANVQRVETHG